MDGESKENWMELCARASTEQDPAKFLELIQEVNRKLEEKHSRIPRPLGKTGAASTSEG